MADNDNKGELNEQPTGKKAEKVVRLKSSDQRKPNKASLPKGKVIITRDRSLIIRPSFFELFLDDLYRVLYIIGIAVLRKLKKYKKVQTKSLVKMKKTISKGFILTKEATARYFRNLVRQVKLPFVNIAENWRSERLNREIAKEKGKVAWDSIGRVIVKAVGYIWSILSTVLNYIAPVMAVVLFITVVRTQMSKEIVLQVNYRGEDLGYIKSEKDFSEAIKEVDSRLVSGLDTNYTSGAPFLQIASPDQTYEITSKNDLVNGIIRASNDDVVEAYGLYANNELVGAVTDDAAIINEIDRIQTDNMSGKPEERIEFEKAIAFRGGLYPAEMIIETNELIDIINSTETSDEIYTVVEGDTPSTIALKMGVTLSVLQDLNPEILEELEESSTLFISKARKFLSIKTIYTDTYDVEIPYSVVETPNALYALGYYNVERAGVVGIGKTTAEITTVDGVEISRIILSVERISEPTSELVTTGMDKHEDPDEAGFMFPAQAGYIGTGVGGYPGHVGVDIIGTGGYGAPVLAAASGTVIKATFSYGGFGNYIEIAHKDGFTTLYAHNTTLYVSVGDHVGKGQIIGTVGSTGNSTGPHIHMEIKQNGRLLDPADFIGTRK